MKQPPIHKGLGEYKRIKKNSPTQIGNHMDQNLPNMLKREWIKIYGQMN